MTILHYILIALEVVLIFNLIIGVHELGHFLAARWCGLKVERFAIWFGKPVWKKKIGGVEYALGTIPFGGYVALRLAARGRAESVVALAPAGGWAEGDQSFKEALGFFTTMHDLVQAAAPHAEAIVVTPQGARENDSDREYLNLSSTENSHRDTLHPRPPRDRREPCGTTI